MRFLGSCEVCGKRVRNYRGLAGHLRHNTDAAHQAFKERWHVWRDQYRATLRCRKCGGLWEITNKALKDKKRCPRCEKLCCSMSKRQYEALRFVREPDPRQVMTGCNSKAQWDGLSSRQVSWQPGGELYLTVVKGVEQGEQVQPLMQRLGITYKLFRQIWEHACGGVAGYKKWSYERKAETGTVNVRKAHEKYRALSPEEKAAWLKKRYGGGSALEAGFADQLRAVGITSLELNCWQAVPINSQKEPREADIKVAVGDGRKVVVLCDGEAFHGSGTIFGDPQDRINMDRETALAYYSLGYSVVRYSETEVHDGIALRHLQGVLDQLGSCQKVYRNWCPAEEESA